jgi:hypothetical protein
MKLPQYITTAEVQRVCKELKINDWTKKKQAKVTPPEAKAILRALGPKDKGIDPEEFRLGLEVELEHGLRFRDVNVTNNHPILTGLIVLAHFKESLDYYKLLDVAEVEGDLLKAVAKGNVKKIKHYYEKLAHARMALCRTELARLK